ncbi:endonuclease V [Micromonospora sp. CA-249363]|uniref:endonuclease V n=1 Tax=Micromonospora sp. CA-249363 TaxID=3239963 RepID=UPI003D8ED119
MAVQEELRPPLVGEWDAPAAQRGAWSPLRDGGEVVGRVVRTRDGVKPVFVSVGHRMSLENATARVFARTPRCRLPETTRTADRLCRDALAPGRTRARAGREPGPDASPGRTRARAGREPGPDASPGRTRARAGRGGGGGS